MRTISRRDQFNDRERLMADDKDAARLDWLDAWMRTRERKGYKWDSFHFVVGKPVREQIDGWIETAEGMAELVKQTGKSGGDVP